MDAIDRIILSAMQDNARITAAELDRQLQQQTGKGLDAWRNEHGVKAPL